MQRQGETKKTNPSTACMTAHSSAQCRLIVLLCAERLIVSLKQFRLLSQTRNLFVMRAHIQRCVCVCVCVCTSVFLCIFREMVFGGDGGREFHHRVLVRCDWIFILAFCGPRRDAKAARATMANVKCYALCRQPPQQPPCGTCPAPHSNRAPSSSQSFWRMYCCCSSKRF